MRASRGCRSRPILAAAVVLLAAALAGCKSQGPERALARFNGAAAVPPPASDAPPGADTARSNPPRSDPPRSGDGPAGARARVVPQDAGPPDPGDRPADLDARPERFRGLAPAAVDAALGPPTQVRTEGPARVWQYRGRGCVLDLVFYPSPDGAAVRHLEARDPVDAAPRPAAACLSQLVRDDARAAEG